MKSCPVSSLIVFLFLTVAAAPVVGQAALGKRTSLDLNAVAPKDAFGSLAETLGCRVDLDPSVATPVTVRLNNITVRTALNVVCESIGCSWHVEGNVLHVQGAPARKPAPMKAEALRKVLDAQTPADFRFENTPLKEVLEALGKVGGIEISVEEPFAGRPVTMDLSSRSILSALQEIGRAGELMSAVIIGAVSSESGRTIKIRFAPKAAVQGGRKPSDKLKFK